MAKDIKYLKQVAPEFQMKRGVVKPETGLIVAKRVSAIFDTSLMDSAGVSNKTVASHGLGVFLPIGAVIIKHFWQVKTAFTSATSAATIAHTCQSAADLLAAVAVSGNPGTAGFYAGIPDGTVTHMIGLSAERELVVSVAVEALTAGKGMLFVDYVQGL